MFELKKVKDNTYYFDAYANVLKGYMTLLVRSHL